jgi:hypothetical protein
MKLPKILTGKSEVREVPQYDGRLIESLVHLVERKESKEAPPCRK